MSVFEKQIEMAIRRKLLRLGLPVFPQFRELAEDVLTLIESTQALIAAAPPVARRDPQEDRGRDP